MVSLQYNYKLAEFNLSTFYLARLAAREKIRIHEEHGINGEDDHTTEYDKLL